MRQPLTVFIGLLLLGSVFTRCNNAYDPELETPNVDDAGIAHGNTLTQMGCFVFLPWQYYLRPTNDSLYNVTLVSNDKEIYSKGFAYTPQEAGLVFQLYKNKSLKYWLKTDYIHSPIDTTKDGGIIKHGVPIDNNNIKNIYVGSWNFNGNDSSFKFNFTDNRLPLPTIEGKYADLGNTTMSYQSISIFDSTIDGKVTRLKKIVTKYFSH